MTRYTNKHKIFMAGLRTAEYFKMTVEGAKEKNDFLLDVLCRLQRTAKRHKLFCEFACNGFENEKAEKENDYLISTAEHLFSEDVRTLHTFLKEFATLEAQFQHDPRGNTCKIMHTDKDLINRDISFVYFMEW